MSSARDIVACPQCGSRRIVDARTARRSRQNGAIPCAQCRGQSATRVARDSDFRFWLNAYGSEPPRGTKVREFALSGGAPPELVAFAAQCYPDAMHR